MSENASRRKSLTALARRLGLRTGTSGDLALLDAALTHDSFAFEHGDRSRTGERLEFLGDAVLGAVAAAFVFRRHARSAEGTLSRRRAALVSRDALAATARRLELGEHLLLGKGEAAAGGVLRPRALAAAFEAVVGAVFLHEGFDAARRFVERHHLTGAARDVDEADPKTALQELAQSRFKRAPTYKLVRESGPAHAREYVVTVNAGGTMGTGAGTTKKQAQVNAAACALAALTRGDDKHLP